MAPALGAGRLRPPNALTARLQSLCRPGAGGHARLHEQFKFLSLFRQHKASPVDRRTARHAGKAFVQHLHTAATNRSARSAGCPRRRRQTASSRTSQRRSMHEAQVKCASGLQVLRPQPLCGCTLHRSCRYHRCIATGAGLVGGRATCMCYCTDADALVPCSVWPQAKVRVGGCCVRRRDSWQLGADRGSCQSGIRRRSATNRCCRPSAAPCSNREPAAAAAAATAGCSISIPS